MKSKIVLFPSLLLLALGLQAQTKWTETNKNTYKLVANKGGQTLGYSPQSGIKIIQVDGFAFKDLNKNGKLDLYEDWRKPVNERAKDLAAQMTVEQIAGLMLYSRHQAIPAQEAGMFTGTYNGKPFSQSGAQAFRFIGSANCFFNQRQSATYINDLGSVARNCSTVEQQYSNLSRRNRDGNSSQQQFRS